MDVIKATPQLHSKCQLGEGPVWHENSFWWVDIQGKLLLRASEGNGPIERYPLPELTGFAVPEKGRSWIVGLTSGIYRFTPGVSELQRLHAPESAAQETRFNDGKCDPWGRLWAGTMSLKGEKGAGSLYRIGIDSCERIIPGVSISNGLAWDPDRRKMYYIDTPTREIAVFDYDPSDGAISNKTVLAQIPEESGSPDGMSIDTDGRIWVAMWGGYAVLQIDPDTGTVLTKVEVPAPNVTSCAFGGPNLNTLYMTTARAGLSDELLESYPHAGDVFSVSLDASGYPVTQVNFQR